jgi:hypothetical protein
MCITDSSKIAEIEGSFMYFPSFIAVVVIGARFDGCIYINQYIRKNSGNQFLSIPAMSTHLYCLTQGLIRQIIKSIMPIQRIDEGTPSLE